MKALTSIKPINGLAVLAVLVSVLLAGCGGGASTERFVRGDDTGATEEASTVPDYVGRPAETEAQRLFKIYFYLLTPA